MASGSTLWARTVSRKQQQMSHDEDTSRSSTLTRQDMVVHRYRGHTLHYLLSRLLGLFIHGLSKSFLDWFVFLLIHGRVFLSTLCGIKLVHLGRHPHDCGC
jgi:hypothetical protein